MKTKLFTLLMLLSMITVAWADTTAPTGGPHTPGTTTTVTSGGRNYEVFFSNNAVKTSLLVGSNTSSTTEATSTTSWCNIGSSCGDTSNSISTAFTLDEFVSNVKTSNHTAIRVQSTSASEKNVVMVVKGYDGIATLDKDEVQVYAEIYNAGTSTYGDISKLTAAATKSSSSHNKRSYNLDASKQYRLTIAYGTSGSTNKTLVAFSLRLPTVSVTVSAAGYATYVNSGADLNYTSSSIKAYKVQVTAKGTATLTQVNNVPKNTPVLLYKDGGATEAIPVMTDAAAVSGNDLVAGTGATVPTTDGGYTNMILNNVGGNIGFYFANDQTVASNRAYLHFDSSLAPDAGARMDFVFDEEESGEVTGIRSIENGKLKMENYYNLNGQKIQNPTKGLYIVNGKKVIIK